VLHSDDCREFAAECNVVPTSRRRPAALDRSRRRSPRPAPVNTLVVACSLGVAAVNGAPALLGSWRWHRWQASRSFWIALRAGQVSALVLAVVVGGLALAGHYSHERLFYLYALLPLAVSFVAEQLRVVSAQTILERRGLHDSDAVRRLPDSEQHQIVASIVRREMGVMTLSAIVVVFLALRAAATAHGF
jgi:hypothetical protein